MSTSMCMLRVCPCVLVTVGSTLSAAVDISAVVMGALFSSRCRQYHPSVTLHCHVALSKKKNTPERNKWRERESECGRKIKKAGGGGERQERGKASCLRKDTVY